MKQYASLKRIVAFFLVLAVTLSLAVGAGTYSASAENERTGVIATNSDPLSVRAGAGTSFTKLGELAKGTLVTILAEETAQDGAVWYKILYREGYGYVHSKYVTIVTITEDADFETYLQANFPESYWEDLRTIHALYPNWIFKPINTNTNWEDAVAAESVLGLNLVSGDSISSYKSTMPGAYDWNTSTWKNDFDSGNWVQASEELIAYYLDPRNYLDANYIFTFLDFAYDESQTAEGLAAIMKGTFMENDFTENGETLSYVDVIMDVGRQMNMNPYVLATIFRIELGVKGSNSISGTVPGYEGYYNYYNIGAYAANGMTAIQRGLWYAKGSGSGSTTYNRPWNSRTRAILGGAMFYSTNYVSVGQDTAYFKKFNVVGSDRYPPYTHQYMTPVTSGATEGKMISKAYDDEARTAALIFKIPVFNNMPEEACPKPTGDGSPNNKLTSLSVENYELTPGFSADTLGYDVVVDETAQSITISASAMDATATISGTGTFELSPGINTFEVVVTAQNGQERTYVIDVDGIPVPEVPDEPVEPENPDVPVEPGIPDDPDTPVDPEVPDEPVEPEEPVFPAFHTTLTVSESVMAISGLPSVPYSADALITALGVTDGSAQVVDGGGNAVTGNVGTGDIILLLDTAGETVGEYTLIVYGDVNGDGKFSSLDTLRIQKHLVGITTLTGAALTAADATRDGKISSLDTLRIQKTILKIGTITQ